ncbi:MAG: glycosyltransferase, partial [Anaerolineales bacterium]|nr:glycosyltransferase [Anaerolineales bacterium]
MRPLIVATNKTAENIRQEVKSGKHQRVDYLELSERFASEYVDYNSINENRIMSWLAAKLRIDFSQAMYVARLVRTQGYDTVLSLSERVGIPLAFFLNRQVRHIVIMHHPLSTKKLSLIKWLGLHHRWHKIIAISQAEAAVLRETLDLEEDRVLAVNTPVDTEFFAPYEEQIPLHERDHIQSVGLSYRDYPTLITAMKLLPQIKCHLRVGSAWVQSDTGFSPDSLP